MLVSTQHIDRKKIEFFCIVAYQNSIYNKFQKCIIKNAVGGIVFFITPKEKRKLNLKIGAISAKFIRVENNNRLFIQHYEYIIIMGLLRIHNK